jgi:hypothetical protein
MASAGEAFEASIGDVDLARVAHCRSHLRYLRLRRRERVGHQHHLDSGRNISVATSAKKHTCTASGHCPRPGG